MTALAPPILSRGLAPGVDPVTRCPAWPRMAIAFAMIVASGACSKIQHECSMNVQGHGTCAFTNTGMFSGSVCGKVVVALNATTKVRSALFCSGSVGRNTTNRVEFDVFGVDDTCTIGGRAAWNLLCSMGFVEDGEPEPGDEPDRSDESTAKAKDEPPPAKADPETLEHLAVRACGCGGGACEGAVRQELLGLGEGRPADRARNTELRGRIDRCLDSLVPSRPQVDGDSLVESGRQLLETIEIAQ